MAKKDDLQAQGAAVETQGAPPEAEKQGEGTASKAAKEPSTTAVKAIEPGSPAWYEQRVPITLFKDNGKYREDVFVAVNGESCQIQRGVEVLVKRKFALALENSRTQDMEAARIAAAFASEYEGAKGALE